MSQPVGVFALLILSGRWIEASHCDWLFFGQFQLMAVVAFLVILLAQWVAERLFIGLPVAADIDSCIDGLTQGCGRGHALAGNVVSSAVSR